MHIQLDFRSNHPIYLQIVEQIQRQIADGQIQPGDQLPTVRQLATDLRVNFNTVARAYRLLDEAGLISTQHGRGTYVWEQPPEAERRLHEKSLEEITQDFIRQASRQGYQPQEILQAVEQEINTLKQVRTL